MNNRSSSRSSTWSLWAFLVVVVCLIFHQFTPDRSNELDLNALHQWLKENKLSFLKETLQKNGVTSIGQLLLINLETFVQNNDFNSRHKQIFTESLNKLQIRNKKLSKWLEENGLEKYLNGFHKFGYTDLEIVKERMHKFEIKDIITSIYGSLADYKLLIQAVEQLKTNSDQSNGWIIIKIISFFFQVFIFIFSWLFRLLLFGLVYFLIKHITLPHYQATLARQSHHLSVFQYLIGNYLDPSSCQVKWQWKDGIAVGNTVTFVLKLFKKNPFLSYDMTGRENLLIEVSNNESIVEVAKESDLAAGKNAFRVTFHPKKSGRYTISILVNGRNISGSPSIKTFLPGPVDLSSVTILNGINIVVLTKGVYYPLKVETRDKYNNLCKMENMDLFKVDVKQLGSGRKTIDPELVILPGTGGGRNWLHIKIEDEGCFHSAVTYKESSIINGSFDIISLSESDSKLIDKATLKNSWHQTWYEGFLLPIGYPLAETSQQIAQTVLDQSSFLKSCRKVYFYFSSRQLIIKEFYLKIIPYRLYSFRISPSTKIVLPDDEDPLLSYPALKLNDGIQPPVYFMSPKRSLIVATFARLLLRNIGGAESLKDKKKFFYNALRAHHGVEKYADDRRVKLNVNRRNILESSYEATKNFSVSKWCRRFFVTFEGEEGYDCGGVTREWISVLCTALFDPRNEMFTQFNKDDKQALIYPNPRRPPRLKLKYYEFAGRIVGKCIFESSCGDTRRLNVKARFMQSFLAQLIGLRVNYKYFKTDDKQLYSSKIKYIQDVDPEDLNLVFSEEEYDANGKLLKDVELIPNGSKIPVTQHNKMQYLDALAQYRLHTHISAEIEAFTKGLNELVPDNLLTMFNEQELELLICGTSDICVNDLKKHHKLFGAGASFTKVMNWFWKAIALFNQEEIARLLQFTTGSSQLPPGGFEHLTPTFSFMSSHLENILPTAHTCFNQLVLPNYSLYEEFHRCLHLAITEGCEGFGFG